MTAGRKRTLQIDILMDPSGVNRGVQQTQTGMARLSGEMHRVGAATRAAISLVATSAVVKFGAEMAQLGARVEGIGRRVDTVFGGSAGKVRLWAETNREAFGMSTSGVLDLAGSFGDLLVPMGFTRDTAADLTVRMLTGANALSEWTGGTVDAATAGDKMIKAMLGEREGLKELGISIDQADVDAELLRTGQDDLTGAALAQAEALATLEIIWQKSADAMAAYEEGGNDALRSQKELTSQIQTLKEELAQKLLPVFTDVADVLVNAVKGVEVIVGWFEDLPGPAKTAALAIGGVSAALWAMTAHPVVFGLTLIVGALAAIGGSASDQEAKIDSMKQALIELGEVDEPTLGELISPHLADALAKAGISLEQVKNALGDEAAMAKLTAVAMDAAGESHRNWFDRLIGMSGIPYVEDEMAALADQYGIAVDEARNYNAISGDGMADTSAMAGRLAAAVGGAAVAAGQLEGNTGRLRRTQSEWKTTMDAAKQSVIEMANAQIAAASPTLQLLNAQRGLAEAEANYNTVMADGTATQEQRLAAQLALVEAQGNVEGAQALLSTDLESIDAFRQLAERAGIYGDELERIVGLLWDYDAAPKPGEGADADDGGVPGQWDPHAT